MAQPTTSAKTYEELRAALKLPLPQDLISNKKQGGANISFVNITDMTDLIDERIGSTWESSVEDLQQIGSQLIIIVRLKVHGSDRTVSHDGTGCEDIDLSSYGDSASNAYAQAFKRAAEKHGIARELWRGEDDERNARPAERDAKPRDPVAKSKADLITPKQVGLCRGIAREKGISADVECEAFYGGIKLDELSKHAASAFIDHLKAYVAPEASENPEPDERPARNLKLAAAGKPAQEAASSESSVAVPTDAPLTKTQSAAIAKLIAQWSAAERVEAKDLTDLARATGARDHESLTEPQARKFIESLNKKIQTAKRTK